MSGEFLSVVVPVHEEQENVPRLLEALQAVLPGLDMGFEVIVVDDGSRDATFETLLAQKQALPWLSVIQLSRNFGHQAALLAGMRAARGDAVITMDGDMQHPPELIPDLVARWRDGYEVVHTRRLDEESDRGLLKGLTSDAFYGVLRWNSHLDIEPGMADFRLLDRRALEPLLATTESALFFRGLALWIGFRQTSVDYVPRARTSGRSSYTWGRMLRFARDGILSFSARPLYWAFAFGLAVAVLSTAYGVYAVYVHFAYETAIPGWASLAVLTSFLFGLLFILLGLIGAYLGAIHTELKGRPRYIVRRYEPRSGVAAQAGAQRETASSESLRDYR
jgi:dolichol-phosphate mannosyltransferase